MVHPRSVSTVEGVRSLETAVEELPEGVIFAYGLLYGPALGIPENRSLADAVRQRERPASKGSVRSLHVEDAARAALLAIDWPAGVVDIVDDEPAAGTEWLPRFAAAIGAPLPPMGEHGGGEALQSDGAHSCWNRCTRPGAKGS